MRHRAALLSSMFHQITTRKKNDRCVPCYHHEIHFGQNMLSPSGSGPFKDKSKRAEKDRKNTQDKPAVRVLRPQKERQVHVGFPVDSNTQLLLSIILLNSSGTMCAIKLDCKIHHRRFPAKTQRRCPGSQ